MLGVSFTITGMRVFCLHQRGHHLDVFGHPWPTAEPMPRSDMPCGQPKFSSDPRRRPGSSTSGRIAFQAASSQGTMIETIIARSGQSRFTCLISRRVHLQRAVGDQLDVVSPRSRPVPRPRSRRSAGRSRSRSAARPRPAFLRTPRPPQPALEGSATTLYSLVGRRRRGEPEGVGRLDAHELEWKDRPWRAPPQVIRSGRQRRPGRPLPPSGGRSRRRRVSSSKSSGWLSTIASAV